MKRYLTLFLVSGFILSSLMSGCTPNPSTPQQFQSQTENKEEPPKAEASPETSSQRLLLGFYPEGGKNAKDSLMQNLKSLDEVAFFWYTFDGTGKLIRSKGADLSVKTLTQKNGAKALALVHNMVGSQFDTSLAHKVLANSTLRSQFIAHLVSLATETQWDGLLIDLEKIDPADRNYFSAFITELKSALKGKNKILNVALHAKYHDDPKDLWSGAYDYAVIGKAADQVVLMTYDEHSIGTTQGPIASMGWVNRVVQFATGKIPKEKIIMGLPIYGYEWFSNKPMLPASLTVARAVQLASEQGAPILYDESQEAPHYSYTVSGVRHDVYFENDRSLTAKLNVAKKSQLLGIAVWRLGLEDSTTWSKVLNPYGSQRKK